MEEGKSGEYLHDAISLVLCLTIDIPRRVTCNLGCRCRLNIQNSGFTYAR